VGAFHVHSGAYVGVEFGDTDDEGYLYFSCARPWSEIDVRDVLTFWRGPGGVNQRLDDVLAVLILQIDAVAAFHFRLKWLNQGDAVVTAHEDVVWAVFIQVGHAADQAGHLCQGLLAGDKPGARLHNGWL